MRFLRTTGETDIYLRFYITIDESLMMVKLFVLNALLAFISRNFKLCRNIKVLCRTVSVNLKEFCLMKLTIMSKNGN